MAMAFSSEAAMATTTTAVTTTVRQQLFNKPKKNPNTSSSLVPIPSILQVKLSRHGKFISALSSVVAKASSSSKNESIVEADAEDGVQLGTMKLPANIDIPRFEILLFQWANSLCQGANLPLPMPLKVDKISGGARLGFIEIGDAKTETPVYIDCLVFPGTETSAPVFRAIRNGRTKDRSPPGEPRIMRSLQEALKKSVQIASA